MKKLLSILSLAIVLFTVTSCKKETVIAPNNNQTILDNIKSTDWVTDDGGVTYHVDVNMPEIDDYFNDHGGVLVYLSFTDGVWEQVPEVYGGSSYSYTHNNGNITLYAQKYNGTGVIDRPDNSAIKIVLVDSQ